VHARRSTPGARQHVEIGFGRIAASAPPARDLPPPSSTIGERVRSTNG